MKKLPIILFLLLSCCYAFSQSALCERAIAIECGEAKNSNNVVTPNSLTYRDYGNCTADLPSERTPFSGRDVIYKVTVEDSDLKISLTNLTNDLDLFVFRGCEERSCVARSINGNRNNESITLKDASGTYYIVIDAQFPNITSGFRLTVDCKNPCDEVETEDEDCDEVSYSYAGSNGSLRFQFNVPSNLPVGTWTAKKGNSRFPLGTGRNRTYTFNSTGQYEICYNYKNEDGCEIQCCKNIYIENPYDCDRINYTFNGTTNRYELNIPGIAASNVLAWIDDDNNNIIGTGTTVTVPVSASCVVRRFSVRFYDPVVESYRICCLAIYICDPYDCDQITATENTNNYTLTLPGVSASNILRWQDDLTLATIANAATSVNVPKPAAGQCGYYSVFFYDIGTNSYRICCLKICTPDCEDDLDCDLLDFNYSGTNGSLRYTFNVPNGTPNGKWTASGGAFGNQIVSLGSGTSVSYTFPATGTYTIHYEYTDENGCTYKCCKTICIAGDPYDCDLIQQRFDAATNTWILSVPNIAGNRVDFWQNDITFARFGQGQTSVSVPNPPAGECGYYSVKVFDAACGGYKLCCLKVCNEGCASIKNMELECTDDPDIYTFDFDLVNTSGRSNLTVEFTLLSPLGVAFQGCASFITVNNINTNQTLNFDLEGCLVPLTPGMNITFKVTLRDPNSDWCCHLDPITVTLPECDPCFGTPDPDRICNTDYDPVCGCDGVTYSNACEAIRAGVKSWTTGECPCTDCPDDPLAELSWLKDLADGLEQCCNGGDKEIKQCKLDGKCVYIVPDCATADGFMTIYDCDGNIICQDGGFIGNTCDELNRLQDCKVIWTCGGGSSCDTPCIGRDLVANGDFEQGNFGFGSDLNQNCACAFASYCVNTNAKAKCNNALWDAVTSAGNFLIVDGGGTFPYDVWNQANINIVAGTTYNFNFDFYSSISGDPSPTLELWVGNTLIKANITGTVGNWVTISSSWTAIFSGAVTIAIKHVQRGGFDDFGIDNVQFVECQTATGDPLKDIAWLQPFVGNANYSIEECTWNGEKVYVIRDFCFVSDGTTSYYDCKGNLICESFQSGTTCASGFSPSNCTMLQTCSAPNSNSEAEDRSEAIPTNLKLSNQPNPFHEQTTIRFTLTNAASATLSIFDATGKQVYTTTNDYTAEEQQILFNRDNQMSAGLYYYRLATDSQSITKSMMVLD